MGVALWLDKRVSHALRRLRACHPGRIVLNPGNVPKLLKPLGLAISLKVD